jgi:tyrosyl-tRNA synthetase
MDIEKQLKIFKRGIVNLEKEEELVAKLKEDRPLRIKWGIDPSSPDIHIGHVVPIRKLKELQDLGHEIDFLIGDFTATVGDPTGRNKMRPPLSLEEVRKNAKTYTDQAFKILDPVKTRISYNGDWLAGIKMSEMIKISAQFTMARMMERDTFEKRWKEGLPIHLHEFFYCIFTAYDSIALKSDVEIGATEQFFNLLQSRTLQAYYGHPLQVCMTVPILVGTDGREKMSKSLGNAIGITEPPDNMFGKVMSIPDETMPNYFELATMLDIEEIERIKTGLSDGSLHPNETKKRLGLEIVKLYHGEEKALKAREDFERIFSSTSFEIPQNIPELVITDNEKHRLIDLALDGGVAKSKGEARRKIHEGALKLNGEKVTDELMEFQPRDGDVISIGKRSFVRIRKK